MENIVLVDTNIVYYLCGISSSIIFDDEKFKSDKNQIAISFFSFFEILIKFQNDKIHLTKTLKYLNDNCIAFIHLQKEHISYNNIFKKCLYSKNKIKYYREKFTNLVIECFVDFMSDLSLLIGGLYLGVLYKTEKEKNKTEFLKSVFCANKLQPAFKKSCDENFKGLFNKYYNSHNKNKSDERKLQFEDIITELFKAVLFIYESYKVLNSNSETFTNEFEDLKTHTLNLNPIYFDLIKSGEKIFEGRLNDEKRKTFNIGDKITFYKEPEKTETMEAIILDKYLFESFDETANELDKSKLGFENNTKEEMINTYRSFYSKEDENKYGVVVFKIKTLK